MSSANIPLHYEYTECLCTSQLRMRSTYYIRPVQTHSMNGSGAGQSFLCCTEPVDKETISLTVRWFGLRRATTSASIVPTLMLFLKWLLSRPRSSVKSQQLLVVRLIKTVNIQARRLLHSLCGIEKGNKPELVAILAFFKDQSHVQETNFV